MVRNLDHVFSIYRGVAIPQIHLQSQTLLNGFMHSNYQLMCQTGVMMAGAHSSRGGYHSRQMQMTKRGERTKSSNQKDRSKSRGDTTRRSKSAKRNQTLRQPTTPTRAQFYP